MALTHSQIVPAAFWVGFLVLGLATSSHGTDKRHSAHATRALKAAKASPATAVIAETTEQEAPSTKSLPGTEVAD